MRKCADALKSLFLLPVIHRHIIDVVYKELNKLKQMNCGRQSRQIQFIEMITQQDACTHFEKLCIFN